MNASQNMLTAMTRVTVLGILAMVSTQLCYVWSLMMFFWIGETDTTYQMAYAFRGANVLLDVIAVYCNLGALGKKLYFLLFGKCDKCMFHCCKKVTLHERMKRGIELNDGSHGTKIQSVTSHSVDSGFDEEQQESTVSSL